MGEKFKNLLATRSFLQLDKHEQPSSKRLRVAIAVILWEMAYVDGSYDKEEFERMIVLLNNEFHMFSEESSELVELVEILQDQRNHFDEMVNEIVKRFDLGQREHLYDMICDIARIDGKISNFERAFAGYLRGRLFLPEE